MSFVSPIFVGRQTELSTLDGAVMRARQGEGSAVLIVGEPGIGKTRLASSAAAAHTASGVRLIRSRAGGVPLRAISEAVFVALRTEAVDPVRLGGFWPVLWRLVSAKVPGRGRLAQPRPEASDGLTDPPLVRAEAVLRLLAGSGAADGCILLLEDLHDADADTLDVVDYLVDNIADQPVLLLATLRPDDGPALALATSAAARRAATMLRLPPLDRAETAELAAHCLAGDVPPEVLERLHRDAEGNPFVIEELLGAMVEDGGLSRGTTGWAASRDLRTQVPVTVTAAVLHRVDRLEPDGVAFVQAAAVLGRRFSLRTAAAAARLTEDGALRHLRLATEARLVRPETGDDPDRYAFRHALTAEAILTRLLPGERARLCRRVAAVVEVSGTDDQVAADLWAAGERPGRAGALYRRAGRRAADQGALATAVALLDRGLTLLGAERESRSGAGLAADLLEELVRALVLAGDTARVFALAERVDAALATSRAPVERRVAARLARARAAAIAGQWERGLDEIADARDLVGRESEGLDGETVATVTAPIDAVAAQLVLGSGLPGRLPEARRLAERALAAAGSAQPSEAACEALEVLGRCARGSDFAAARRYAERLLELAQQHRLPLWRVRAMLEIGTIEKYRNADPTWLLAAREAALTAGAVVSLAWTDVHLANTYILRSELDQAQRYVDLAARAARQLRLRELELLAIGTAAGVAASRGRRDAMEELLSQVQDQAVLGYGAEVWAHIRGICSLLEEDHERALAEFAQALRADRRLGQMRGSGHQGPYLLLRVVHGQAGWPEQEQLASSHLAQMMLHQSYLAWSRAVLLGREGRPAEATTAAGEALRAAGDLHASRHLGARLAAQCALADGWGDPLAWLAEAEEYFHRAGVARIAAACRALLRGAGTVPPQRRAGHDAIPAPLRRAGVTVREYEVLRLLTERLGNIEIAERLFLSPRTVERHVASLRQRTGQPDRAGLIAYARAHVHR